MLIPLMCLGIGVVMYLSERIFEGYTHRKRKQALKERAYRCVCL